jgi:ABC-type transport system substrate-binding protein
MTHPLVGGYAPQQVALRRAIALAMDVEREIRLLNKGLGVPAHSPIPPHVSGWDAGFASEMGQYSPGRAKALLDLYGYLDRDGDGWREQPDGSPLLLEAATQPGLDSRQSDELFERDMTVIGLRVRFQSAQWPEQLKAARAGKPMLWSLGLSASAPDGMELLVLYDAAAARGGLNFARFDLPAMNAVLARLQALPDGPERQAAFTEAKRLAVAWMPYKMRFHPVNVTVAHPWLIGYRRPLFANNWYETVDIDRSP